MMQKYQAQQDYLICRDKKSETLSFEYPTLHHTGSTKWKVPKRSNISGTKAPMAASMAQRACNISKLQDDIE